MISYNVDFCKNSTFQLTIIDIDQKTTRGTITTVQP